MSYFGEYFWVSKIHSYFGGVSWKGCGGFYGDGEIWWLVGRVLGRWRVCPVEVKVGGVRLGLNL